MRRYRALRDDMSQDELAKLVGRTTGAISQIERGLNVPRRGTAQAIDNALDAGGAVMRAFGYAQADALNPPYELVVETVRLLAGTVRRLAQMADLEMPDLPLPVEPMSDAPGSRPGARSVRQASK